MLVSGPSTASQLTAPWDSLHLSQPQKVLHEPFLGHSSKGLWRALASGRTGGCQ
ncbi:hypothetical protein Nmel_013168 [Mimus melanotis]